MTSNWRNHRFQDLVSLAERAAGGHMAFGPVTIQEGQHLETLLAEATQYQEAHAHSQELRAKAETEREKWRDRALAAEASLDRLKALADALYGERREKVTGPNELP